ncbi:hypothetical protein KSX_95240 [Ktedonospora formicarum]|uniref:Uncharacterized protein n=1 Tax=Ktedonospora formicarum TaxID=2778364 RepID=A0A8J3IC90_9CHLR|nr:hypothetical protein KSX_95240 [Ktedonospora formicarum]
MAPFFYRLSHGVPGLSGEGACVAVMVAMDHPSRGFHFPSQVDRIHGDTVAYGWDKCQPEPDQHGSLIASE